MKKIFVFPLWVVIKFIHPYIPKVNWFTIFKFNMDIISADLNFATKVLCLAAWIDFLSICAAFMYLIYNLF